MCLINPQRRYATSIPCVVFLIYFNCYINDTNRPGSVNLHNFSNSVSQHKIISNLSSLFVTARRTVVRRRLCFHFVCPQGWGGGAGYLSHSALQNLPTMWSHTPPPHPVPPVPPPPPAPYPPCNPPLEIVFLNFFSFEFFFLKFFFWKKAGGAGSTPLAVTQEDCLVCMFFHILMCIWFFSSTFVGFPFGNM